MSVHESFEYEQPELNEAFEYEQPELNEAFESFEYEGEHLESYEMELAQELLEVTSEAELEQFLGKLVKRVGRGVGSFMKSGIGKAVGGVLRSVAKTALPVVGSALGSFVAPGIGTALGGKLGSMASKLLEAEEREVMGEAEAELEAARRYVRWANGTVRNAMRAPYGVPPRVVARSAAVSSARRFAPTLLRPAHGGLSSARSRRSWGSANWEPASFQQSPYPPEQTCTCGADRGFEPYDEAQEAESFEAQEMGAGGGRWYRQGNRIVLVGA